MTKLEVKKLLISQDVKAFYNGSTVERYPVHEYQAWLEDGTLIEFRVPNSVMKLKEYDEVENASDLIKWLKY